MSVIWNREVASHSNDIAAAETSVYKALLIRR